MTKTITRQCQMDDWIFEVKMVRALKMKTASGPYSAVASFTTNGEQVYIDTHLSIDNEELTKDDYLTFYRFCQALGMKSIRYDRMKNGVKQSKTVDLEETLQTKPVIRLVK